MSTRRRSERFSRKLFIDHILGEEDRCLCVSDNFSAGGLRLTGAPGKGWGTPRHVWLQFRLPTTEQPQIRALAELRYESESETGERIRGFRFKYMSPRERNAYNQFVEAEGALC
jgi:c-di-GMP-binding flagellar brake protein YcgR